jgi:mercuric ion transport protein
MNIELIYDRDCPNAERARTHIIAALAAAGREARWAEWDRAAPETPAHAKGYGSPTILVNGKDVAGAEAGGAGPSCRLYRNAASGFDGTPSVEQIVAALRASDLAGHQAARGRSGCCFNPTEGEMR